MTRNKVTAAIRDAKRDFYLNEINKNFNLES